MPQVFIVAALTGYRDKVQALVKEIDADAHFENAGNGCSFWVCTKLTRFSLEAVTGVSQVFISLVDQDRLRREVCGKQ